MVLTLLAGAYFAIAAVGIEDPALKASAETVGDGRLWVLLTRSSRKAPPRCCRSRAPRGWRRC
jgi:hypothetical protein